jgi:ribosomal protein S18 acetylase RimI-like enzyme
MENKIVHVKANSQGLDSWISMIGQEVVGHIYMQIQIDNKIKFLDAWVHPDYRRIGIYRKLWEARWNYVNKNYKGYLIFAWCKDNSLPLLIEKGFSIGEKATYVEKII